MIAFSICLIVTASPSPDLQHACRLARRGAQAAGELGEVVRRVQLGDRIREAIAVDEIVPVGNQVPERAAVVAERHAAVHAAGALLAQILHRAREQELAVVVRALDGAPAGEPRGARSAGSRPACPSGARSRRPRPAVGTTPPRRFPPRAPRGPPARPVRAARACSRGASPSRTPRSRAAPPSRRARAPRPGSRCAAGAPRSARAARAHRPERGSSKPTVPMLQRSGERAVLVQDVGHAAAHARREVPPGGAEHDHAARPSCTRSRGRRCPRRPPRRPSFAPRIARRPVPGRTPCRRWRRTARCCRRSRSARP